MSMANMSDQMKSSIHGIDDRLSSNVMCIHCIFTSSSDPELIVPIQLLHEFDIIRNFSTNVTDIQQLDDAYADILLLAFEVKPDHAIKLLTGKDIRCELSLIKYDSVGHKKEKPFITLNKDVLFPTKSDILKKYPLSDLVNKDKTEETEAKQSMMIPLQVQLVDTFEYNLRKIKTNGIFKGVTMKGVITYLAKEIFGFKHISIVEPDNDRVYTNFIIPPMHDMSSVFNFIQDNDDMGVYEKGLNFYVYNETLYVYPKYETDVETKPGSMNELVNASNIKCVMQKPSMKDVMDTGMKTGTEMAKASAETAIEGNPYVQQARMAQSIYEESQNKDRSVKKPTLADGKAMAMKAGKAYIENNPYVKQAKAIDAAAKDMQKLSPKLVCVVTKPDAIRLPETTTMEIYKLPKNSLEENSSNHKVDKSILKVMTDCDPVNMNLTDEGIENLGNVKLIQHTDRIFESYHNHVSKQSYHIFDDNVEMVGLFSKKGGSKTDVWQSEFVTSNGNVFKHKSELSAVDAELVVLTWKFAVPGLLYPGMKIKYHYDGDNYLFQIREGVLEAVHYEMMQVDRQAEQLYGFIAHIQIRINVEIPEVIKKKKLWYED